MDRDSYRLGSNIIAKYYVWQIWPPYPCMLHLEYITYLSQNLLNQFFLLKFLTIDPKFVIPSNFPSINHKQNLRSIRKKYKWQVISIPYIKTCFLA